MENLGAVIQYLEGAEAKGRRASAGTADVVEMASAVGGLLGAIVVAIIELKTLDRRAA